MSLLNKEDPSQLFIIAGPCLAESYELLETVCSHLVKLSRELSFDLVFKTSFDKANRSSLHSPRGPGWKTVRNWFIDIKEKYNVPLTTDIHETNQAQEVGEICDILQIPAFLSRQTDLLLAAAQTGKQVNVKKGQFLAPGGAHSIVRKIKESSPKSPCPIITERGSSFGYGDLIVDMRSFKTLSESGGKVCFDITHSLQKPASLGTPGEESKGARNFAPSLTRSACASGYLDGFFFETHTNPKKAFSDKETQLTLEQSRKLLTQIVPLWKITQNLKNIDSSF